MKHIKTFFGVLLIATAIWTVYPVLSKTKQAEVPEITTEGLVMLDFYADWCVACKEYEKFTFSDPNVKERLSKLKVIKVDVTDNTDQVKAILKQYELFGPPAIVFIKDGKEIKKIVGYKNAEDFAKILDSILKN